MDIGFFIKKNLCDFDDDGCYLQTYQSRCEHLLVLALRNSSSVEESPYTTVPLALKSQAQAVDEG